MNPTIAILLSLLIFYFVIGFVYFFEIGIDYTNIHKKDRLQLQFFALFFWPFLFFMKKEKEKHDIS